MGFALQNWEDIDPPDRTITTADLSGEGWKVVVIAGPDVKDDAGSRVINVLPGIVRVGDGEIVLDPVQKKIYINNASFGSAGVQLEYDSVAGKGKFYAGDGDTKYVKFDGTDLTVSGSINIVNGSVISSAFEVATSGYIHSTGKTSYADTDAGFFLGYDSTEGDWVFNIGDNYSYLKWDGIYIYSVFPTIKVAEVEDPTTAPTVSVNTTSGNLNGTYYYKVTFVTDEGETTPSPSSDAVNPANQQVDLTDIPTSTHPKVKARKIYRTKANGDVFYYVDIINDNTTTTYTDNTDDSDLVTLIENRNTASNVIKRTDDNTILAGFGSSSSIDNICIGYHSGYQIGDSERNIAIGFESQYGNKYADDNISIGYRSLYTNESGDGNIAIGSFALDSLTTGDQNVAIGYNTLSSTTSGYGNTVIGYECGIGGDDGYWNIGIGYQALSNNEGHDNIAVGYRSCYDLTTGYENIGIGRYSLTNITTGFTNIAIGSSSAYSLTTAYKNIAIGSDSLYHCSTGNNNIAIGSSALFFCDTDNNVAIGVEALNNLQGVDGDIAIGYEALYSATGGGELSGAERCIGIGHQVAYYNKRATDIIAIGYKALYNINNDNSSNTGSNNIAIGNNSMYNMTTGEYNVGLGQATLWAGNGSYNVAVGYNALHDIDGGDGNTAIGHSAGENITSGDHNTIIGRRAGDNITTGSNNIIIGYDIDAPSATTSYQLNIGDVIYGDLQNGAIYLNDTSNSNSTAGLTINQGANDDEILSLKSSDVSHSFTSDTEADTFGFAKKFNSYTGGLLLHGFCESNVGIVIRGSEEDSDTGTNTSSAGAVVIQKNSGTAGDTTNILVVRDPSYTRFVFKSNGYLYADGSITGNAFDSYNDMLMTYDVSRVLAGEFDRIIRYNKDLLEKLDIIKLDPKSNHVFINLTNSTKLITGAMAQLYKVIDKLCKKLNIDFESAIKEDF